MRYISKQKLYRKIWKDQIFDNKSTGRLSSLFELFKFAISEALNRLYKIVNLFRVTVFLIFRIFPGCQAGYSRRGRATRGSNIAARFILFLQSCLRRPRKLPSAAPGCEDNSASGRPRCPSVDCWCWCSNLRDAPLVYMVLSVYCYCSTLGSVLASLFSAFTNSNADTILFFFNVNPLDEDFVLPME